MHLTECSVMYYAHIYAIIEHRRSDMDLREIIRTYKKKTGATDADIAARTGVSRSTV